MTETQIAWHEIRNARAAIARETYRPLWESVVNAAVQGYTMNGREATTVASAVFWIADDVVMLRMYGSLTIDNHWCDRWRKGDKTL